MMKKYFAAMLAVVLLCSACYAGSRWRAPEEMGSFEGDNDAAAQAPSNPAPSGKVNASGNFDPYYDTTRATDPNSNKPTKLDIVLHEGLSGPDQIISQRGTDSGKLASSKPGEYQQGKGIGRQNDNYSDGTTTPEPDEKQAPEPESAAEEREHQTGLQEWHKGADRQLTDWTFSASQVTVKLYKKGSSKPAETYSMKPYRKGQPHSGFVFSWSAAKGTQIVVPEGCEIHCDPAKVDMSTRTKDDKRGNGVAFSEGDVIIFKKSSSPAFTIFPYHAWPLD